MGHAVNNYSKEENRALIFTASTLGNMCVAVHFAHSIFVDPCNKICVNRNFLRSIIELKQTTSNI